MAKIGHARIDENGKAHGGNAGDQNGKEVMISDWSDHSKGWRVFRARDDAKAAKIAEAMRAACANNNIGYDQYQRSTLYTKAKAVGFDVSKVQTKCETDCSALVRVCCAFAGITLPDFNTASEPKALLSSGAFVELQGEQYTKDDALLRAGDILCSRSKGHTCVVLTDGDGAAAPTAHPTLRKGSNGSLVQTLQRELMALGYELPKYRDDGDFGNETLKAVKAFQTDARLVVDGIVGPKTWAALAAAKEG
jgi:hypothetical protein